MRKEEFLTRLEKSLQDISYEERQSALRYYEEYLDEAGENSEQAIEELEKPEDIAKTIKSDLDIKLQLVRSSVEKAQREKMETEYGSIHQDATEEESAKSTDDNAENTTQSAYDSTYYPKQEEHMEPWKIALIVVACIVCSPIAFGGVGAGVGILTAIFGVIISITCAAGALVLSGIVTFIAGIVLMFSAPYVGIACMGAGIFLVGLGCLFLMLAVWFWGSAVPRFVRWIKRLFAGNKNKNVGEGASV